METWVAAGGLMVIALVHSVLGELGILRPLFAASWEVEGVPRWGMERVMRFAWHLTSVAWVCLGAAALGWEPTEALAACALVSAVVIFVSLRGHLAWPMFVVSGVAGLMGANRLGFDGLEWSVWLAAGVAVAAAALHVYWAFGGERWLSDAAPKAESGEAMIHPGKWLTLAVAALLCVFAGLLAAGASGVGGAWVGWMLWAAAAVLGLRAVGDGRYVGFSKSYRGSRFAELDDAVYTPLVTLLAAGAIVAAVLSA